MPLHNGRKCTCDPYSYSYKCQYYFYHYYYYYYYCYYYYYTTTTATITTTTAATTTTTTLTATLGSTTTTMTPLLLLVLLIVLSTFLLLLLVCLTAVVDMLLLICSWCRCKRPPELSRPEYESYHQLPRPLYDTPTPFFSKRRVVVIPVAAVAAAVCHRPYRIQPSGGRDPFTVINLSDWPDASTKDGLKFKVIAKTTKYIYLGSIL